MNPKNVDIVPFKAPVTRFKNMYFRPDFQFPYNSHIQIMSTTTFIMEFLSKPAKQKHLIHEISFSPFSSLSLSAKTAELGNDF